MAGTGGGVATPPTPKTRGSFEWFQRRRAKWEQAPRPKVISLSSPKPKPTTDSKHVSAKKETPTAASLSFTPVSVDAKERSETQSQNRQQQERQKQQGPFSSGATSTTKTTTTMKITDISAKKPLPPNKPVATQPKPNPFANISLVPSSSSSLSLQSTPTTADTLKTGNASKPPVFGGLSSMSSSSPFTSFGSKPAATQSSLFGEAAPDFSFGKSSNPTTVPASSNLFGGGLFSATPATAKPLTSTKTGVSPGPNTAANDKPNTNKISIFGKPINTFSATSTNNPATIDSTKEANKSSLFMTSAKSSSLSAEPSSKVNTVSNGEGASAETSSTASKTNANPFANVQLVVPDITTTKSVSNNSASSESKPPSQQGDASTSVDKPKTTPNNSNSGLFKALAARSENSYVNSGISAGSTKISEKTDVDANKSPFSFGAATLAAKSKGATTTKATANPFANVQLALPSSTSGTNMNASAKALPPAKAVGEKQPMPSSSSSSYPPLSAKAPTPFSITSGVSSPAAGVTGTGGDAEKAIQPEKPAQVVPATAAGKKAAKAFDKIDAGQETTLPASSFEALLEEIGENFHGDEYDVQLAICDPTKSGNITRTDFVDWYVDLVEGDDTDDDESIDSEEREERAEEEANAKEKFGEIGNVVDGAMSIPASEFGDLIESLGSAYCEEAHRSTLKKLTSSNGMIKEADFLAWYVDWLFAGDPDSEDEDNADDDTDKGKSEDKPSLSSIFQVDAGTWRCDMCSVPNKKDAKKCIACEAPRPGLEGGTDTSKDEKSTTLQGSIGSGGFSFGAPTVGGSIGSSGFSFGAPPASSGSTNTATGASSFSFGAPSASTGSKNTATGASGFSFGAPSACSGSTDTATALPVSTSAGFTFGAPSTGSGTTTTGGFNFGVSSGTSISSPSIGSAPVPATAINAKPPSSSSYPPMSAKAPTPFSAVSANPNPPSGGANVGGGSAYPPIASKSPTPFSSLGNSSAQAKPPTSSSSSAYPPLSSKAPTPFSAASAKPSGGANAGSGSAYPPIASKSPTPFSSLGKPATEATKPPSSSSAYPPMSAKPPTPFSAASTKPSAGSSSAYPPIASKSPTPFNAFGGKSNTAEPSPAQASSSPTPSAPVPAPEKVGETKNLFNFVQAPKSSGSVSSRAPAPAPYSFGDTFPKSSTLQSPLATSNPFATLNLTPSKTPDGKPMQSIFGAAIKPAPKFDFGSSQPKTTNPFGGTSLLATKKPSGSSQPKTTNPFGGTSLLATKKPSEEKDSTASNGGLPSSEKLKTASLFGGTTTNLFSTKNTSGDKPNPFGGPSLIAKQLPPGEKQPSDGVATSATSAEDSAPAAKASPFTSINLFSANPSSGPSPFSGGSGGTSLFSTKAAPSKPFGFGAKASNFSNPTFGAVSPFTKTVSTPGTSPSKGTTESETIGTGGSVDHRTRLLEFYKKYNPEKLNSVDATLEKYKGKEEELFKKLDARYVQSGFPLPGGSGPTCYLDFSIDGKPAGRVVVKLYQDKTPFAAENFRCLCTGEKGVGRLMKPLHYKNCKVHRLIPGFCVQLGDFTKGDGTGGESIYSPSDQHTNLWGKFVDEPFMRHARKGLLSMANNGPNQNGSQFFFTLKPCPNLDGKHVVFGEVVEGFEVVEMIEACETDIKNAPKVPVIVVDCGEIRV